MLSSRTVLNILFIVALTFGLSGCSFVTGLFPDKQKQYRYDSDLPPLEIPPDLTSSTLEGTKSRSGASDDESAASSVEENTGAALPEKTDTPDKVAADKEPSPESKKNSADTDERRSGTLAQTSEDTPLIEIQESFPEVWNNVNRALGRLEIEVSDQNRTDGLYYVYYGGETKKYEDTGLWGDVMSLFRRGAAKGEEYRIKVEDKGAVTNIYVMNKDDKPATDGAGVDLLKKLHDKLKTLDQPEPDPKAEPAPPESASPK